MQTYYDETLFQPRWTMSMKSNYLITVTFSLYIPGAVPNNIESAKCTVLNQSSNDYTISILDELRQHELPHRITFEIEFENEGIYEKIFGVDSNDDNNDNKDKYNYRKHCEYKYDGLPIEMQLELIFNDMTSDYQSIFCKSLISSNKDTNSTGTTLNYSCKNIFVGFDPIFYWQTKVRKILCNLKHLYLFDKIILSYINFDDIKIDSIDNYNYPLWDEIQKYQSIMNVDLFNIYETKQKYYFAQQHQRNIINETNTKFRIEKSVFHDQLKNVEVCECVFYILLYVVFIKI